MTRPDDSTAPPSDALTADATLTLPQSEASASAPEPTPRLTLPGYEVLGVLGRGGMGVVYKARQTRLQRTVALKMVLAGEHAGAEERLRFQIEAEAVAALQHPNIVTVYEVGELEGRPYVALEYCPGGTLADRLRETPLPPKEAARLVETLARAVHAAHQAGIVHRDLKPGNVLLASGGCGPPGVEVPGGPHPPLANLIPKITDFGLAKRVRGGSCSLTQTGAVMGTPSYMAPEQAGGGGKHVGPAADIYALGAILYECLTGRPPFKAATPLDTMLQVIEHTPTPPQMLNPKVDHDLTTVCLKCLEKDPARRYASAEALADDLRRYRDGVPIRARSYNMLAWVTRTLEQSQYDVQFSSWGRMLLWFAAIVGVGQLGSAALIWSRPANLEWWLSVVHVLKFGLMALIFWRVRSHGVMPTTTAERQMWSLWAGFFAACFLTRQVGRMLASPDHPYEPLNNYPYFAILSALAFVVLGSSYWGGCYLIGAAFFGLAALMPYHLAWSPVTFGVMWAAALVITGQRLRRLSRDETGQGEPEAQ